MQTSIKIKKKKKWKCGIEHESLYLSNQRVKPYVMCILRDSCTSLSIISILHMSLKVVQRVKIV